jgi:sugar lactone lactonase YvrE
MYLAEVDSMRSLRTGTIPLIPLALLAAIVAGATHAQSHTPAALFKQPAGIAVDAHNRIFIVDNALNRVTKLSPSGKVLTSWGSHGSKPGQFASSDAIALGPDGSVYVTDGGNARIDIFSPAGKLLGVRDHAGAKVLGLNGRLAVDRKGNLWIALGGGVEDIPDIVEPSSSGKEITQWKAPKPQKATTHEGIAVDPRGFVYLRDEYFNRIFKFTLTGKLLATWKKHGSNPGQLDTPEGLALDAAGNLYVADQGNNRVQELSPSGKVIRTMGDFFSLSLPSSVAVDSHGTIYITTPTGIHVFSPKGKETAVWH